MKNILFKLLIIASGLLTPVFSQISSNCTTPTTLLNNYEIDVKNMTLNWLYSSKNKDTAKIEIPRSYQDTIWHGLAAIFNLSSSLDRDSVFNIYCIHNSSPRNIKLFNSVIVGVDPSYSWTSAWASSTTITGFTALDNLLSRHGYSLTSFSSSSNYALLTTNKDLNTLAMSDSLELLMNGITYAEPNFLIGDGNRIDFNKSGDTLFYDFSLGWSDCPSGCINRYGWKFKVSYSKCEVTSMGGQFFNSWGSYPLPPTVNCNLTGIDRTNQEINVTVFPNPVSNFLQLNFSDNILKSQRISIVDVSGKTILKRNISSKENRIDVSMLKNGVYILLMEGKSNHSFEPIRFVKI